MLDRLTLDQLRTMIMVAEEGSFSAAGRKLRRVQSAVSQTIQTLEATLGIAVFDRDGKSPVLTEAGKALLADAKRLIASAEALRARAESIASDVEPELAIAVEALFPNGILMASLETVIGAFPDLAVTVFTETLGGALQRLREGAARLAFFPPMPGVTEDIETAELLAPIDLVPVVAVSHPLARAKPPLARSVLEEQLQLVLTDRTQITARLSAGVISRRIWRFADLNTRLDFLLNGFGWCYMPLHIVADHIAAGRLKRLQLKENPTYAVPIHVIYPSNRPPGRAGKMLIAEVRRRLAECPGCTGGRRAGGKAPELREDRPPAKAGRARRPREKRRRALARAAG